MLEQIEKEKLADIQKMRPLDDAFFEVLARNKGVCEEILRTILEDDNLVVNDVITQESERNLFGRSLRLDALCTLSNGTKCNIEVQRANNDDHLRRVRFNASNITIKYSASGEKFEDVIELYIVYISDLMTCFTMSEVNNPKFPRLSAEVTKLKTTEGGISTMCEIMEESNRRANKEMLFGLVAKKKIKIKDAADELDMSVDEFLAEMEKAEYKVPTKV